MSPSHTVPTLKIDRVTVLFCWTKWKLTELQFRFAEQNDNWQSYSSVLLDKTWQLTAWPSVVCVWCCGVCFVFMCMCVLFVWCCCVLVLCVGCVVHLVYCGVGGVLGLLICPKKPWCLTFTQTLTHTEVDSSSLYVLVFVDFKLLGFFVCAAFALPTNQNTLGCHSYILYQTQACTTLERMVSVYG